MTNFTKNAIATLSLVLLTHSASASYVPNTSGTLDIEKFSSTWNELYRGNQQDEKDLRATMNTLLDNDTLDIAKFSSLWHEVYRGDKSSEQELKVTMSNLLDHSVATLDEACIEASELGKLS